MSAPTIRFEHRLFGEAVRDDFESSPLLHEQPFEKVGRPGEAPMRDRQALGGRCRPRSRRQNRRIARHSSPIHHEKRRLTTFENQESEDSLQEEELQ
jgi:hypothetical protein